MINKKEFKLFQEDFGEINSEKVFLFHLSNGFVNISITNYGCTITSILAPDRFGNKKNIVAGFNSLDNYLNAHPYLGCVVGRFANRIAFGKFTLNRTEYQLPINDGLNHLHGGINGFNRKVWKLDGEIKESDRVGVRFSYISPDGEEGYPGRLETSVTYVLGENNELTVQYRAITDKPTIINLTNHSYFNLTGFETPHIYDHTLKINAGSFTEKNESNIPSGNISSVLNTPFDFRKTKKIREQIYELKKDGGYDHNFVLDKSEGEFSLAAELHDEKSGRLLKVFTDRPGLQVYTANFWDGTLKDGAGNQFKKHGSVALETQSFPDGPNHPNFPGTTLNPGEIYITKTSFQFLVK